MVHSSIVSTPFSVAGSTGSSTFVSVEEIRLEVVIRAGSKRSRSYLIIEGLPIITSKRMSSYLISNWMSVTLAFAFSGLVI